MSYEFKRSFFYDVETSIKEHSVSFVLGPRKCGKTICLRQIKESHNNSVYVDAKADFKTSDESMSFITQVKKDIESGKDVIYLIDEATYLFYPDNEIASIADSFAETDSPKTKVVFTGSQSKALDSWGHSAFGSNVNYIHADFLSYPEWLAYKHINEISEESYASFVIGTKEFYPHFNTVKDYLSGCLNETVHSNNNSCRVIYNNDSSIFFDNEEALLDVLYASLVSSHNIEIKQTFFKENRLIDDIIYYFRDSISNENKNKIRDNISSFLFERYKNYKSLDSNELKKAFQFLYNCGLITITPVSDNFDVSPYAAKNLINDFRVTPDVDFFYKFNICIKYPMFYVELVKEMIGEDMPDNLPNAFMGDIIEKHVRGLLSDVGCMEYHDDIGKEIDYVNTSQLTAIEITKSNKSISDTHFDVLPEGYKKILLTKSQSNPAGDIQRIPYYKFIFENSEGQEMINNPVFKLADKSDFPIKRDNSDKTIADIDNIN